MQNLLKQETEPRPDFRQGRSTELVVRKWLVVFGELFHREISPFLIASWCEVLAPLTPEQADRGCAQIAKTWTFSHFPTPGAVLSQFDKVEEKGFALESEQAWEKLLAWVRDNYYPDSGIRKGAPRLPAAIEHAARAAGGFSYIERCSQDELVWCRKTFLAAYKNVHETEQVEHLLSDGAAKRILAGFSKPPALPAANPEREAKYPPPVMPADLPKLKPVRQYEMTQEEWDARRAFLKAQADEIAKKQEKPA